MSEANLTADDWTNPFIRAGNDVPAYVSGKQGIYPEVFFRYRRLPPKDIERKHKDFRDAATVGGGDPAASIATAQKLVFSQLTEWSFGVLSKERIEELNHPLLLRIFWIVIQTDATEPVPAKFLQPEESSETGDEDEAKKS